MINFEVLATGSTGNCTIIENQIALDIGISYKKLGAYSKKLKLVFISHCHSDHFNKTTVKILARERPTLRFCVGDFLVKNLIECGVSPNNIDILQLGKRLNYKLFSLQPILLYHDVMNFGLRLFINGHKILYATDTNTLEGIVAKDYDLYLVEGNYSEDEIDQRIKEKIENDGFVYEFRAKNNHLSIEQCNNFLIENMGNKSSYIYMHKHIGKEADNEVKQRSN